MRHRHLLPGYEWTVPAVEDVLDRGTLSDWRELAAAIRQDPWGPYAVSLERVVAHTRMYGTTRLWQDFLDRVRREGAENGLGSGRTDRTR